MELSKRITRASSSRAKRLSDRNSFKSDVVHSRHAFTASESSGRKRRKRTRDDVATSDLKDKPAVSLFLFREPSPTPLPDSVVEPLPIVSENQSTLATLIRPIENLQAPSTSPFPLVLSDVSPPPIVLASLVTEEVVESTEEEEDARPRVKRQRLTTEPESILLSPPTEAEAPTAQQATSQQQQQQQPQQQTVLPLPPSPAPLQQQPQQTDPQQQPQQQTSLLLPPSFAPLVTVFEFREEVVESLQEQEQEFVDDESDDDMFYQIPEVVKRNFLKRKGLIK